MYSTCTFNEQFLPMTTQQRSGQEGSKVHKYLPKQRRHFLQGTFQLGGDAADGKEETEKKKRQERNSETSDGFMRNNTVQVRVTWKVKLGVGEGGVKRNRSGAGKTC